MSDLPIGPQSVPVPPLMGPGRPGYKTTSFWLTLGTFLVSGFVLTGVVSMENQDTIGQIVGHAITSIGLIAGQTTIVWKYLQSRHKVAAPVETKTTISTETVVKETTKDDTKEEVVSAHDELEKLTRKTKQMARKPRAKPKTRRKKTK